MTWVVEGAGEGRGVVGLNEKLRTRVLVEEVAGTKKERAGQPGRRLD